MFLFVYLDEDRIYETVSQTNNRPVKGEPLDIFTQHQARRHEELGEVERVDPLFFVFFKLQA